MSAAMIECHNLSHFYAAKAALSNVSLELPEGESVGLVGPNGAGKTTLLNILCGFLRPTKGTAQLFGYRPGATELIGKVSALPQDAKLDPSLTIAEQLIFYARLQGFDRKQAKAEVIRIMEAVDLKSSLNEKPVALSHGMGKRVVIAQALIGNPQLIMLDEPTAGLDPVNTRNIRSIIAELSSDTTFIISSHNLEELDRLCRSIILLENGIIKPQQSNQLESNRQTRFITVQMEPCPASELVAKLQALDGVVQISSSQKNEFIIEYNSQIQPRMDQQIMNCIANNHWNYRQLIQGKSLEEKLFFGEQK
jgi:ABC-2 type transport system ATP-binding protein